jgi:exodeoxyribonuclease V beta subunit
MRPLDINDVDLSGTHLVEAGAGTGKTYAIASLYLRLLLEERLGVESILVVTFTVPATDELRIRIRNRLKEAFDAFRTLGTQDEFLEGLLKRIPDRAQALRILSDALSRMDEASIFTIHGFCYRVLSEMAFETASPFTLELTPDETDMLERAAADFFRLRIMASDVPELVSYALHKKVSPAWFMRLASRGAIWGRVIPAGAPPELGPDLDAFRTSLAGLRRLWREGRDDAARLLLDGTNVRDGREMKPARVHGWMADMDRFLSSDVPILPPGEWLGKFTPDSLGKVTRKGGSTPSHPLFDACGLFQQATSGLMRALDRHLVGLKVEFVGFLASSLERWKALEGRAHFDDLIMRVHRSLATKAGPSLVEAVRARYRAALIDEFQDTDALQYDIFRRCFEGLPLFFIGDPKQAIYSFRGADVFTYFRASGDVPGENRHTLIHNYRSDPDLVEAVNALFSSVENPFATPGITFEPALPALGEADGSKAVEPLEIWVLGEGDRPGTVVDVSHEVCTAVASEIARILRDPDDGLRPAGIAVLVRTHRQARMVRDALRAAGIPCVLSSDENVFASREAAEMALVLDAILNPRRENMVRLALLTRVFGLTPARVFEMNGDEAGRERHFEVFMEYNGLWRAMGFTPMFRMLVDREGVRGRLLGSAGGERALTNVLHLAELLGSAEARERLGMQGLRKWLALRMDPSAWAGEEAQLRLESDEDAVRVLTVHKSKGLEFDVVFCPFAWSASGPRDDRPWTAFHDESGDLVFDAGSEDTDRHREQEAREGFSEEMRLLYVALTRARRRCCLALLGPDKGVQTAPAYLIGDVGAEGVKAYLARLGDKARGRIRMSVMSGGTPPVHRVPSREGPEPEARVPGRTIDDEWGMASYTGLVRGVHPGSVTPVRDLDPDPRSEEGMPMGPGDIFAFPRGAKAGTVLHEIFDGLDFGAGGDAVSSRVKETLAARGFDLSWTDTLTSMVLRVLHADLGGFSLRGIPSSERVSELEFFFPLKRITPALLEDCLKAGPFREILVETPRFTFNPVRGFARGFIDLVFRQDGRFHLVDWKSNHLGDSASDYNQAAMKEAMASGGYELQYLLYCTALDLYLRGRVAGYSYDGQFAGVIYVFLRGVDAASGADCGIYRTRPPWEAIERLRDALVEESARCGRPGGRDRGGLRP